jgi:hypothetical protein
MRDPLYVFRLVSPAVFGHSFAAIHGKVMPKDKA